MVIGASLAVLMVFGFALTLKIDPEYVGHPDNVIIGGDN